MQEKLSSSSSDFENITLPLSQYQKSIVGRNEIVVAGKRYDVKSISIIDEMVTITAIHDTEEENVISLIGKTLNSDKEKIPNCFLKLMSLIYASSSVDDNYSSTEDKLPVSIFIANGILSPQMEILSPPPQA